MVLQTESKALEKLRAPMRTAIEEVLQREVDKAGERGTEELRQMLRYHLGWEGEGAGEKAQGKRIRPLLVLLAAHAAGGEWQDALPSAAAVELLHNFSLIHDDIQDDSAQRRGRPTLWKKWGIAQAINAGDSLFALAHDALKALRQRSVDVYADSVEVLPRTSLELTQGQYLDLAFENRDQVSIEEYWRMVEGKTAMLLSSCARLGAISAQASKQQVGAYAEFGKELGLAFQAHDDILGIWGNETYTGKSTHSDLISGKKSLPVLFGLAQDGEFAKLWQSWDFSESQVDQVAEALERDEAREYTERMSNQLTQQAMDALYAASPNKEGGEALRELALELVKRKH